MDLFAVLVLLGGILAQPSATPSKDEESIRAILQRGAEAWNRGDLDDFMTGYEDESTTLFIGSSGPIKGYANIAAMYRRRYKAPNSTSMGRVGFSDLDIRLLGNEFALVAGRWTLAQATNEGVASGYFTLTFRRTSVGWKIICDHTH